MKIITPSNYTVQTLQFFFYRQRNQIWLFSLCRWFGISDSGHKNTWNPGADGEQAV